MIMEDVEKEYLTVLIVKGNDTQYTNGFGASFQIITPEGYGLNLFRRLVYSGCKPIGHREFLSIKLEVG